MSLLVDLLLLICLFCIAVQDFRLRKFFWFFIPALFLTCFLRGSFSIGIEQTLNYILLNSFFFLAQLLLLFMYFAIKNQRLTNVINTSLGIGDILFIIAISPAFSPLSFILFYFIALLAAIIVHLMLHKTNFVEQIPLAGILSICLFFVIVLQRLIVGFSTYYDYRLFNNFFHD